jgi:tetratricopeptide (TPR) repeat protein
MALDWYQERRDTIGAARAAIPLANTFQQLGRTREAIAMLESIVADLGALPAEPDAVRVLAEFGRALMIAQDERALEVTDRALVAAEQLELTPVIAEALVTKAAALDVIGRRIEGIALVKGALEIASSNGLISTELRGRGNLAGQLWLEDPRGGLRIALDARELARSVGDRSQFTWSTMHALGTLLVAGSWDEALALVEDLDEDNPTGLDPEIIYSIRAIVAAFRGQAELAAAQFAAYRAAAVDATRAEFQASRLLDEATHAMLSGQLDEAYGHALAAARLIPYIAYAESSLRYALWLGDVERVRLAAALLQASVERGRFAGAIRRGMEAGVAAIEGRVDEAGAGYRAAAATLRDLDLPLELGLFLLDYATLIGPDEPGARAAAAEAREIFTRLGSPPLLARLDGALAKWEGTGPTRTPASPERSVADVLADA